MQYIQSAVNYWFLKREPTVNDQDFPNFLIKDIWLEIISHLNEIQDLYHVSLTCKTFKILTTSIVQKNSTTLVRSLTPDTLQCSIKLFRILEFKSIKVLNQPTNDATLQNLLQKNNKIEILVVESKRITSLAFLHLPTDLKSLTLVNCTHVDSALFPFLPEMLEELNLTNSPFISEEEVANLRELYPKLKVNFQNESFSFFEQTESYLLTHEVKIACLYWMLENRQNSKFLELFSDQTRTLDPLLKVINSQSISLPQFEKAHFLVEEWKSLLQILNDQKNDETLFSQNSRNRFLNIQKVVNGISKPSLTELIIDIFIRKTSLNIHKQVQELNFF